MYILVVNYILILTVQLQTNNAYIRMHSNTIRRQSNQSERKQNEEVKKPLYMN